MAESTTKVSTVKEWYVFDGMAVLGPFSEDQLSTFAPGQDSDRLLVCKRGMATWTSFSQFQQTLGHIHKIRGEAHASYLTWKDHIDQQVGHLQHAEPAAAASTPTWARDLRLQENNPPFTASPQHKIVKVKGKKIKPAGASSKKQKKAQHLVVGKPKNVAPHAAATEQLYLTMRGRLRLGQLRSPSLHFVLCFASFGLVAFSWYIDTARELFWYLFSTFEISPLPPRLAIVVPGYNCFVFYRMGLLLNEGERKAGIKATSAYRLFVVGLFPPLALFTLQRRLNHLWKACVHHNAAS